MNARNDTLYIDDSFYYLKDPVDKNFQFHHLFGLAYSSSDVDALIRDLTETLDRYGIYWFDPTREEDAFFDDDPINNDHQDVVFDLLKPAQRRNYIVDVLTVLLRHEVLIFRCMDHKSFLESDAMDIGQIRSLYESNFFSLLNDFMEYAGEEDASKLCFVFEEEIDKLAKENEMNVRSLPYEPRFQVLHVALDFFHSYLNLYLRELAKPRKTKDFKALQEIHQQCYPALIYDKYAKVRKLSQEITAKILKWKK